VPKKVKVIYKFTEEEAVEEDRPQWDNHKSPEPEESQWGLQPEEEEGTSRKVPVEFPGWGSPIMMSRAPSPELW
jgi:hypothetical protein